MDMMDEEIRKGSNGWALIYDCDGGTNFNNHKEYFKKYSYPVQLVIDIRINQESLGKHSLH